MPLGLVTSTLPVHVAAGVWLFVAQVPKLLCCITDMSTRVDNVVWYMEQQTQLKRIQCHNCIGSAEGHVDTLVYT